jgi:Leucine-rich repeat (LRR) protein
VAPFSTEADRYATLEFTQPYDEAGVAARLGDEARGRPSMSKIKILFLASDPFKTHALALDEEIRAITAKIRSSDYRDALELISAWAVTRDDLHQLLLQHKPHIVHFSGHGTRGTSTSNTPPSALIPGRELVLPPVSQDEQLVLTGEGRRAEPISKEVLVDLFKKLPDNVQLVFLNACRSAPIAADLAEVIPYAIGMREAITDDAAIAFASAFYQALGFGRSLQEAFDLGQNRLMIPHMREDQTPRLYSGKGVKDPKQVKLVIRVPDESSISRDQSAGIPSPFAAVSGELKLWLDRFGVYLKAAVLVLVTIVTWAGLILASRERAKLPDAAFWMFFALALLPSVAAFVSIVVPEFRRRLRERWVLTRRPDRLPVPFTTSPLDQRAFEKYSRADQVHFKILDWLKSPPRPILILTGKSGTGKSSLLDAFVLPSLRAGEKGHICLVIRSYDDPVRELRDALWGSGLLDPAERDTAAPTSTRDLLKRAAERLGQQDRHMLLVFDQFEELIIIHGETPDRVHPLQELLSSLNADPIVGLTVLLSLRDDYKGVLETLALPLLDQKNNWQTVEPFTIRDTCEFLRRGFERIGDQRLKGIIDELRAVEESHGRIRELRALDETRGLIRPIVANMIGVILYREPDFLSRPETPGTLLLGYVRRCIERSEVRDLARQLLNPMLTQEGTKRPRSVSELKKRCPLNENQIENYLLEMYRQGLVRAINQPQNVLDRLWEISHDFVADLIDQILNHPRKSAWATAGRAILSISLLLCLAGIGVLPAYARYKQADAIQQLAFLRFEVNEAKTKEGELLQDESGRTYLDVRLRPSLDRGLLGKAVPYITRLDAPINLHLDALVGVGFGVLHELHNVKMITLDQSGITDLTPLAAMTGLEFISLNNTGVSDLSPLKGKTGLHTLSLVGVGIADLGPLAGLTNLRTLDLSQRIPTDLRPLRALVGLQSLSFGAPGATDLSPLGELKSVRVLRLQTSGKTDFSSLARLTTTLESLSIGNSPSDFDMQAPQAIGPASPGRAVPTTTDLGPLAGLRALRELRLSLSYPTDLGPLAGLTMSLSSLSLNGQGIEDLKPLSGLAALRSLYIDYTSATDLKPLGALTGLERLSITRNPVPGLEPLSTLTNLTLLRVDCQRGPVQTAATPLPPVELNVMPLGGLIKLQTLGLTHCRLSDLSSLAALSGLKSLDLSDAGVTDIGPLAGLSGLIELRLDKARIKDFKPLARLKDLAILSLNGVDVTDFEPLEQLSKLRELSVPIDAKTDIHVNRLKAMFPELQIHRTTYQP